MLISLLIALCILGPAQSALSQERFEELENLFRMIPASVEDVRVVWNEPGDQLAEYFASREQDAISEFYPAAGSLLKHCNYYLNLKASVSGELKTKENIPPGTPVLWLTTPKEPGIVIQKSTALLFEIEDPQGFAVCCGLLGIPFGSETKLPWLQWGKIEDADIHYLLHENIIVLERGRGTLINAIISTVKGTLDDFTTTLAFELYKEHIPTHCYSSIVVNYSAFADFITDLEVGADASKLERISTAFRETDLLLWQTYLEEETLYMGQTIVYADESVARKRYERMQEFSSSMQEPPRTTGTAEGGMPASEFKKKSEIIENIIRRIRFMPAEKFIAYDTKRLAYLKSLRDKEN